MEYTLKRSKRKTISISVRNAEVHVSAPLLSPKRIIDDFVKSKRNWIDKHLNRQQESIEKKRLFGLGYGKDILFLGRNLTIKESDVKKASRDLDILQLPSGLDCEQIKRTVVSFYKKQAKLIINDKVRRWSDIMGIEVNNIRITSAKTRWGSCSSKRNVNFSWYLIMAPETAVDYVVIHELAHIRQMNHSKKFWQIVERYVSDYKERRKVLRELHRRVETEDWTI